MAEKELTATEESQFLTFILGEEKFGVGILRVKEIKEYTDLTSVPMMPKYIPGVINLRGNVVPIIDVNYLFFKKPSPITRKSCMIILEIFNETEQKHSDVGILVDSVNQVIDIPPSEIESSPSIGTKIRTDFISGIGKYENEFIIILNIKKILSIHEIAKTIDDFGISQEEFAMEKQGKAEK